jgi:hypothetical protein
MIIPIVVYDNFDNYAAIPEIGCLTDDSIEEWLEHYVVYLNPKT